MADYSEIFNQYLNNRFNQAEPQMTAGSQDLSTGTMVPPAVGPTIAASQGQQPANPLNQVPGAVAPQTMEQPSMAQTAMAQPPMAQTAMAQPPMAQPAVPVTGAVNPDYASYIGKNESGNNANIGYHNPTLGTAYGQYGITAPAYKDIQRTDPYFAGKDITSLSAEDQKRALDVFTANSAKALQNYGIEPTQGNLAGAHFLGPKGLNDYLTKGYISPAAAQANGGEARVRHIVDQRLKFNPAAASGATNQAITPEQAATQPGPGVPTYAGVPEQTKIEALQTKYDQLNKDDPIAIMALTRDENPAIASAAKAKAYDLLKTGNMTLDAKSKVDDALANGQIPKYNEKTEEGSYIKAYLFARLGLNDLALQEQQKISPTKQTMGVMLGDQHYAATFAKDGQLLYAYDEDGNKVNDKTLAKLAANSYNPKNAQQHAQVYADPTGKVKGTFVLETRPGGMPVYKEVSTGRLATGNEAANLKAQGVQGSLEYQQQQQNMKNQGQLDVHRAKLETSLKYIPAQEHNKFISKFNAENGTNFALMSGPGGKEELVGGTVATAPTAMPTAQPTVPAMAAPVAQSVAPAVPGAQPATAPGAIPGATAVRPASDFATPAAYKAYLEAKKVQDKDLAEGVAKLQLGLPQYEANAENILNTIKDVVGTKEKPAEGFEDSVGIKGWSSAFGLMDKPLPNTAARNWRAKYDQLMGQEFLDAFNQLRGAGAISNQEGATATKARAALSDPGISEEAFRKNAKILEDTVKKGVDRQRALVGLSPLYPEVSMGAKSATAAAQQEKTIGGVTYVFDGTGWKKK